MFQASIIWIGQKKSHAHGHAQKLDLTKMFDVFYLVMKGIGFDRSLYARVLDFLQIVCSSSFKENHGTLQ